MTREEIIQGLYKGDSKAIKEAIKALEQEPCDDAISRQAAIDALDEIRHALWEIDIPSPTMPEYVEHHEQVQSVWKLLDKKQKELYLLPSAQPEQSSEIQNILEYLDTVLHPIVSPDHWNVYSELHDMISMLASAQPEIDKDSALRQKVRDKE